jgi:hypothetical protein
MSKRFKGYRNALRALRIECPINVPVRVRLSHNPRSKYFGWCVGMRRKGKLIGFAITVCTRFKGRNVTAEEFRDTIVHEWAHALSDTRCYSDGRVADHGPEWGVAFSSCYQAVIED